MTTFVLDNSVTMRWFFEAGGHEKAESILTELSAGSGEAVVPVIWRYEVSSVLSRAQLKGGIEAKAVAGFLEDLEALPISVDVEGAGRILTDVHRVAVDYRLTSYDAAYLEVSLRLGLPLATFDTDLIDACRSAGVRAI